MSTLRGSAACTQTRAPPAPLRATIAAIPAPPAAPASAASIATRAGYEWLIANNYTPRDIVIHGFSLGSGVAVRLAAERPARALILEAPFTGVDDVAASHFTPASRLFIRDSFRTRDWIGDVRMPVLIVHGDADTVIPFAQGERLFALANQPKQFVRMPGSDHATLVRDGIYPHITLFLVRHPPES